MESFAVVFVFVGICFAVYFWTEKSKTPIQKKHELEHELLTRRHTIAQEEAKLAEIEAKLQGE